MERDEAKRQNVKEIEIPWKGGGKSELAKRTKSSNCSLITKHEATMLIGGDGDNRGRSTNTQTLGQWRTVTSCQSYRVKRQSGRTLNLCHRWLIR